MATLRVLLGTCLNVSVYALLLFVPAGTVQWARGWTELALIFIAMLVTRRWVFGRDDALLAERRKPPLQRGQPRADKLVVVAFLIVMPAYIAFIPLDVFRLHVMAAPGIGVAVAGLLLAAAGCGFIACAFAANAFAVPIVKDQRERGQVVIDAGIYRFIRHPLYAGVALVLIGSALWLGSAAAALLSVVPIGVLVARILVEEHFLRVRLAGYAAYAARVRFRLVPGVW